MNDTRLKRHVNILNALFLESLLKEVAIFLPFQVKRIKPSAMMTPPAVRVGKPTPRHRSEKIFSHIFQSMPSPSKEMLMQNRTT
jgi:hypothetical protein